MKIISDKIKQSLKNTTTQRKGRILVNGEYYDVYNVEYYADVYNEGNVIGNAIASQLDFDLPYMEKFETFKYFDGVWTGTEYEYVDFGTFTVFDEQDEDGFNKHITAFDNLIKFNKPFEAQGTYPKTLLQELQSVCEQAEVILKNSNIPNEDFIIENNQFVNGESLKTVLKAICQVSGNYATIKNDELILQLKNETNEEFNESQHEPIVWKRKTYGINQVVLGMADVEGEYVLRQDENNIAENGVHQLIINDNPFAYTQQKREALIDELFNQVRGFGYIPFEMNGEWLSYLDVGDTLILDNVETILLRISGKTPNALESTMSAPAIIDSSIAYVNNTETIENRVSRAEVIVDKQNQEIQALASKVVDVSSTTSGIGSIQLENAHEGILQKLSIVGNVSLNFPNSNKNIYGYTIVPQETLTPNGNLMPSIGVPYNRDILYPSNDLYGKTFKLQVDETIYDLDINYLNYMNADAFDEFIYEDGECYIIRRVGINESGEMYKLEKEVKEKRKSITINIIKDSVIVLLGFANAIMTATYLTQNDYTKTFATQVDLKSEIKVATDNINLNVTKKLEGVADEEGNITSSSIILAVNKDGSSATISADKVNLQGYITATDLEQTGATIINGSNIKTGTIDSVKVNLVGNEGGEAITVTNSSKTKKLEISGDTIRLYTSDDGKYWWSSAGLKLDENQITIQGSFAVTGSKNRLVTIDNGEQIKINAYETAEPYFGDIGSGQTNDEGYARINIDDIFGQTIERDDYKVFIQECGDGHLYIEKHEEYFEVKGTPNINFDWEIKAIQKGFKGVRLEKEESDK